MKRDELDTWSVGRAHMKGVQALSKWHPECGHTCDSGQEFSECQQVALSDGIPSLGFERKLLEGLAAP